MAVAGSVAGLRRYPVKSLLGEDLAECRVDRRGVLGDRGRAVIDTADGRVASAKNPRKWCRLLELSATMQAADPAAGVRVTFPGGTVGAEPDLDDLLSAWVGRPVRLATSAPADARIERCADRDAPPVERPIAAAAPGTFFDYAPVHLITTHTLDGLRRLAPLSQIDPMRFRPNVVLDLPPQTGDQAVSASGRTICIGPDLVLRVIVPTPRCVVPTLAHGGLPEDRGVLRAVAGHNRVRIPGLGVRACAGVYAEIVHSGVIRLGDQVSVD